MRLLTCDSHGELSLTINYIERIPPYAILSHRWGADSDEVTFTDLKEGSGKNKAGHEKIQFCREQAIKDGLQYFWVDTCCIDKANHTELSEAITSMFRWYQDAVKCYVYLSDVSARNDDNSQTERTWEPDFRNSKWFTRGWTLQELLAPKSVEFFSRERVRLGDKNTLEQQIHEITGIPITALGGAPLSQFSINERERWAETRETGRKEDKAYCLLGIFNVFMPLIYGEGDNALIRLQKEIYPSTNRPETPLLPSSTVPFRRDADFIDRGTSHGTAHNERTLLGQIEQRCAVVAARVALVGIGGTGKSQLTIEYSHRLRERSPNIWVFWIYASNAARSEQSYREIADLVKIPERTNPQANIFRLVHDWLCDERHGKWVLILDNLDDASFLLEVNSLSENSQAGDHQGRSSLRLVDYLPQSHNGSILITTRTRSAALRLVAETEILPVNPMNEADAIMLLEKKLGDLGDRQDLATLTRELEFMPLAIVQAAAYISERAPRCSVQQYIDKFRKNDKGRTTLLNHEGGHLRRDREARNSIIITWQISFDHIRDTRPSAADLLSLMSFFDRQGIPEALLRNRSLINSIAYREQDDNKADDDSVSDSARDDEFEEDVLILKSYSFVFLNKNTTTFEMHSLVQLAMRKWLNAHGQLERWRQLYVKNLCAEFPTGEHENWVQCQALFPHVKAAVSQQPEVEDSVREWASLLYHAAWYAWRRGHVADAAIMSTHAMKAMKKVAGLEHNETLSSMEMVGLAYSLGGRWTEAEELFVQVMETSSRVLGAEHPDTLTSMANLASTYRNQGRWTEAEELEVQVMETSSRVLGAEHPSTLTSMANLASTFWNQGRWTEAEELEVQVMETSSRVLGAEHPSTLTSMANLASTYRNQGRWTEAEELEVQVMETSSRVLGAEHPDTLTSMANLASTYRNQGRWTEAEELEVQVMETSSRVLGAEHPDTLTSMANLASTFWNQGRWTEAEELFVQVMETRKRVLGAEHPDTLTSMANLASTYRNQGRWTEAEELEVQVMETSSRVLGAEHPDTLTSMANLAFTIKQQGRKLEAVELMMECVQLQNRIVGTEHPRAVSSSAALAEWQSIE